MLIFLLCDLAIQRGRSFIQPVALPKISGARPKKWQAQPNEVVFLLDIPISVPVMRGKCYKGKR